MNSEESNLLGDCPGLLFVAAIKHQLKPTGRREGLISAHNTQVTFHHWGEVGAGARNENREHGRLLLTGLLNYLSCIAQAYSNSLHQLAVKKMSHRNAHRLT